MIYPVCRFCNRSIEGLPCRQRFLEWYGLPPDARPDLPDVCGLNLTSTETYTATPPTIIPVNAPLVTDANREMFRTRHGTHGPWCNAENCDDYRRAEQGGTLRDDYTMSLDPCAYPELARPEESDSPALTALRARIARDHLSRGDMEAERARLLKATDFEEDVLEIEQAAVNATEDKLLRMDGELHAWDALIVEAGGTSCFEDDQDD